MPTVPGTATKKSPLQRIRAWPLWTKIAIPVVVVLLIAGIVAVPTSSKSLRAVKSPSSVPRRSVPALTVPQGAVLVGHAVSRPASGSRAGRLVIAGVATLAWRAGAIQGSGSLIAQEAHIVDRPGTIDGVQVNAIGDGITVKASGVRIAAPLTLRLGHAMVPHGSTLLAAHLDDAGRWSLLPGARPSPTGGMSISTSMFSIITWIGGKVLKPLGDFLAGELAGRTSPPVCAAGPPWVSVNGNPSGSTHSCVRTGTPLADGTPVAELEIKSNRGTYQWVQIPSTLPREYVWVEDQPDFMQALVRNVFGNDPSMILLSPGRRMTIGYRQPVTPAQLRFHTFVDNRTAVASALRMLLDAATSNTVDAVDWVMLLKCSKTINIDLTNVNEPVNLDWPHILSAGTACVVHTATEFADHPTKAISAAEDILGVGGNRELQQALSNRLVKLGTFAKLLSKVVALGAVATNELTFFTDALSAGIGIQGSTDITLTFSAKPPPAPRVESFYDTWGVHGGGAEFRPDGTGRTYGHDGFTDDGRWINEVETLATKLSADQRTLTVTIVEVHWEANGERISNPYPQYPPSIVAGDTFTVTFEHPHLLKVSALKAQSPDSSFGNPYLCGRALAPEYQNLCGA